MTASIRVASPSAAEVTAELPAELRSSLALLHGADRDLTELTLAMLPFAQRTTLVGLGVMDEASREHADDPVAVTITELGRDVIATCALEGLRRS